MRRLTREHVRQIDRRAVQELNIPSLLLMENAARSCADVAQQMVRREDGDVLLLCGGGNNGGDGLALARHLYNRGFGVAVCLAAEPEKLTGDPLVMWNIVTALRLPVLHLSPSQLSRSRAKLIVDALFGIGINRPLDQTWQNVIGSINDSGIPVLSVDVPSGLDCDTGEPQGAAVRATRTVTFLAEKVGFENPTARAHLGQVHIADIGVPPGMIRVVTGEGGLDDVELQAAG